MQIETNITAANVANTAAHSVVTAIPTMERPAGLTINEDGSATYKPAPHHPEVAVHEMSKGLSHARLKKVADELAQRRVIWEEGALRSSNQELFALLADCLALYLHLTRFDDARKEFHAIYKERGFESTKGTSLMTKIVRYVFGERAQKRTFAYAKVLNIAVEQSIAPEFFPAFVTQHGGIEEIRRNGVDAEEKRQQRAEMIEKAAASLKVLKPLAENLVAPNNLKVEGKTNFVAIIARKEANDTLSLVHVTSNETLVDALLVQAAKEGVTSTENGSTYADERFDALSQ